MPEIGEKIAGKYRITKLMGKGGMGAVYQAEHEELGKQVAVKFLHAELAAKSDGAMRFKREARAAAATGHRSIVDVYDIGETDDGSTFLVMQLLHGESLGQLLKRRGTIEPELATYVAAQVLSALEAAHGAGIVHRDIKPDNVFLVKSGQALPEVMLLDFGASQMVDPANPEDRLTQSGMLLGTPYYMAPEQASGSKDLDGGVDVYAVGVILYEALTGTVPFQADSLLALVRRILEAPLALPREHDPDISEELEQVVVRALERDRDERWSSAAAMLEALLPFMDDTAASRVSIPESLSSISSISSSSPEALSGSETVSALRDTAASEADKSTLAATTIAAESEPRRRNFGLAAVGVVIVAAVVVAGLYWPAGPAQQVDGGALTAVAPEPDAAPDAGGGAAAARPDAGDTTTDAAPEATMATVTLLGVPDGAEVFVDDERMDGPTLSLERSPEPRAVAVKVGNRVAWSESLTIDGDRELEVEVNPSRPNKGGRTRPRTGRPRAGDSGSGGGGEQATETPPANPDPTPQGDENDGQFRTRFQL